MKVLFFWHKVTYKENFDDKTFEECSKMFDLTSSNQVLSAFEMLKNRENHQYDELYTKELKEWFKLRDQMIFKTKPKKINVELTLFWYLPECGVARF